MILDRTILEETLFKFLHENDVDIFEHIPGDLTEKNHLITKLLDMGYFTAPCSSKHHLNCQGGLFTHSINVMNTLVELTEKNDLKWERPESPYIIGLFHDICKADNYIYDTDGFAYNKEAMIKGHGIKSVAILSTLLKLTEEEMFCIIYHMGAFTDTKEEWNDYTRAIHKYPNVLWTHQADMIATHIIEFSED